MLTTLYLGLGSHDTFLIYNDMSVAVLTAQIFLDSSSVVICIWQVVAFCNGHCLHLCHHGYFVHGPIVQFLGKEVDCPQDRSFYVLDYRVSPHLILPFDEHLHVTQVSSHPLHVHVERSIHTHLPQRSFLPIFQSCFSKPLIIHSIHWLQSMNQWTIIHLAISPSKQNVFHVLLHYDIYVFFFFGTGWKCNGQKWIVFW